LSETSWLVRHDFLLRRLHSLTGLIPVGAYLVIHLLTNATLLDSPAMYQDSVYRIHSLGRALVVVEWVFIFLPLIFHSVFGILIIRGGLPNNQNYPYVNNLRYTLQRVTGVIAFVFIFWHVFHMHGWFHSEAWLSRLAEPLGGAQFRPFNAASSLAVAMSGLVIPVLYAIGVVASVFHLANGIWTMGITWGVWISERAQRRASWACLVFGIGLGALGLGVLFGVRQVPVSEALEMEQQMYDAKVAAQQLDPERAEHKRWSAEELDSVRQQAPQTEAAAGESDNVSRGETTGLTSLPAGP
jgi:succinate dehydrogenase / fumarate reductase cytochrome b subunit